ncbi:MULTISPECIES: hybrid sensor histidine kinase/response regulator [Flavobacteriaceae]|uniref:hybrid sensor histidine kinase/response regulator n=1 Tax=Flavobacteriaceae TaxID=49546 RepID=UPI001492DF4A|nr:MULTISPECIES: hybrid sensor histidine kinase/response regulator [Allomuricauda]MDC6365650.1 hybrid sensor histidine kinase/response regulator [Muricauda sp. AC10]
MNQQFEEKPYVLAIDDELLNIELMKYFLERQGLAYKGVNTISDFLEALESLAPDIILMDVVMPKKNGFDLCRELKEFPQYQDIPVIFITGKTNIDDKVKGFEAGGVDYITKPFNEHELIARVKTHCNLKMAKAKIETQAKKLQQSNALKNRIFSIIGHDLRSPLSAAKLKMDFIRRGIIDPAADNFKDETVLELLTTMDESLNLLQNLMAWGKSGSNQVEVIPEILELNQIVEQVFRLLSIASERKGITLINNVPADAFAHADLNTTMTVFRNLISNAIKFTPSDGQIVVNAVIKDDRHFVEVQDNGQGIPKEDIPKILNPDLHFSKLGTENEPGTGLGLILCQDFVRKNGGELKVDSTVGKGTTFYFDLAIAQKEPA